MKRTLKASGFVSALSLFGVCVVGCSAEVKPEGDALDIGNTSQGVSVFTPAGSIDLEFSGELAIPGTNKVLILGGYDHAGVAQTTSGILDMTGGSNSWTTLSSPLPTALGEVEIAELATNVYLVAGGRAGRDGAAVSNTYILSLSGSTATWTTLSAANDLITGRVIGKNNLKKCGNSNWIAIGGITNGGMASTTTTAVTEDVEVFTYNSGTPANSSWSTLRLGSDTSKTVKLATGGHGYHEVLAPSTTKFIVAGGVTNSVATAVASVEILEVNSSCQALDTSVVSTAVATPIINTSGTSLPSARARMSSIKSNVTISGTTYDFVVASGNNTTRFSSTPPTEIFFYRSANNSWYGGTVKNLNVGRVFGRLVQDGTSVKMATGLVPDSATSNLLYNTTDAVDAISSAGAVSAQTALANSRVGSVVQSLGGTEYAIFGTKFVNGNTGTAQTDVESF